MLHDKGRESRGEKSLNSLPSRSRWLFLWQEWITTVSEESICDLVLTVPPLTSHPGRCPLGSSLRRWQVPCCGLHFLEVDRSGSRVPVKLHLVMWVHPGKWPLYLPDMRRESSVSRLALCLVGGGEVRIFDYKSHINALLLQSWGSPTVVKLQGSIASATFATLVIPTLLHSETCKKFRKFKAQWDNAEDCGSVSKALPLWT